MRHTNLESVTPGNRRASIEIMTSVLQAAEQQRYGRLETDGGFAINQRDIMRKANINHSQLSNYLDILEDRRFIIRYERPEGLHLEITEKGERLLERTQALTELLQ